MPVWATNSSASILCVVRSGFDLGPFATRVFAGPPIKLSQLILKRKLFDPLNTKKRLFVPRLFTAGSIPMVSVSHACQPPVLLTWTEPMICPDTLPIRASIVPPTVADETRMSISSTLTKLISRNISQSPLLMNAALRPPPISVVASGTRPFACVQCSASRMRGRNSTDPFAVMPSLLV